jgi:hydrogenase/urease accessory protein HupE
MSSQSVLANAGQPAYLSGMSNVFNFLVPAALLAVFAVLCFGIFALFKGGDFGRSWSNRAMRMRVLAQFVAIIVLLAAAWTAQNMRG